MAQPVPIRFPQRKTAAEELADFRAEGSPPPRQVSGPAVSMKSPGKAKAVSRVPLAVPGGRQQQTTEEEC
jgi:hypothetical protein